MKRTGPDSVDSWLIALACSFISMIIYAVVRLSGVLFVASMTRFDVDRQSASMPYILTDFIQAISSPLTGYLAHKFGLRLVMSLGCLVSAIGIGACFFAEHIRIVTVFWGAVFGVGFGLSCPLLAVMVTQYFVHKRAMAIGFVYFGGYIGYSVLPSIVEHLIEHYGLSGTFLYISGLMLNCIPAAMLLRKPKFSTEPSGELNNLTSKTVASEYELPKNIETDNKQPEKNSKSRVNEGFELENNAEVHCIVNERVPKTLDVDSSKSVNVVDKPSDVRLNCGLNKTVQADDSFQSKYSISSKGDDSLVICNDLKKANSHSNLKHSEECFSNAMKPTKSSIKAITVFLEPVFIVVLIAEAVFEGSFIAFVTILVDFSMDAGLPLSDAKYVLIAFAISSNIGLLGFGWVTDNGHLTLTTFSGLLLGLRCVTVVLISFSVGLPFLLMSVSLHGLCESPLSNLFPLIIADYYVKEVHEMAISCRLFLCAPVYLVTPYLIGYFRDDLGSYLYLFYLISLCSLFSGILLFLAPQIAKFRCGRKETILRNKSL